MDDNNFDENMFSKYNDVDFENQIKQKYFNDDNSYDHKFNELFPVLPNNDDNNLHSYEQFSTIGIIVDSFESSVSYV